MKLITPSPERLRDILAAADSLLSRLAYMPSAEGPATTADVIAYMEAGNAARTVVGLLPKVLHIGDGDDPAAGDFRLAWSGFTDALARLVRHYQWHAPLGPGSHKDIPADRRSDYLAFLLRPGDIGIVQDLRRGADHLRRFTDTLPASATAAPHPPATAEDWSASYDTRDLLARAIGFGATALRDRVRKHGWRIEKVHHRGKVRLLLDGTGLPDDVKERLRRGRMK
jgi:hypothetical protein